MHPEELLDLVDENDNVVDTKLRADIYAAGLKNFRVINAFLKNNEGKLWIPRRTAHKAIYPLALDFSVGGHVSSGETYEEAFVKEVNEELNIDVSNIPYKLLGYFKPTEGLTTQFMHVYEMQSDEAPNYNPDDFIEAFWLTPQELVDRIEGGDSAKTDLPVMARRFYL